MILLGPVTLDPSRRLWSVAETAEALNISRSSVRRLVARGELEGVRLGRRVLVRPDGVRRLLGEQ